MKEYRKKPIVIEAEQWFSGRCLDVIPYEEYKGSKALPRFLCRRCGLTMEKHGYVYTLEGPHIACPGDWIIAGVKRERYPCKTDIFEKTYENLDSSPVVSKPREPSDENKDVGE